MTAPPWGHKPLAVDEVMDWWIDPPPEPSPRREYWLRRLKERSWHPNRRFHVLSYHSAAEWLGVWIWEYNNIIAPAVTAHYGTCLTCCHRDRPAKPSPATTGRPQLTAARPMLGDLLVRPGTGHGPGWTVDPARDLSWKYYTDPNEPWPPTETTLIVKPPS